MKVLIISDAWHPQINGVVRTYECLSREMEKQGIKVEVFGPAHFSATMPMPFYPEIRLVIKPYRKLTRMIDEFKPDKIHIATEGPLGWAARKYCLRRKRPFTSSYHTQFPDYVAKRFAWLIPPLYNAVYKLSIKMVRNFHNRSDAVLVSTQGLAKQLRNWGFKAPMKEISRGVDTDIFYPGKKTIMKDMKPPIALYVGRLAIEKNLDNFLEMPWEGSKVLVGDGPIRKHLEAKYDTATFTGTKSGKALADYYRSADVFVFPSKTDTFGIVMIEALACGLPVAGYDVTGPRDIITHDFLGALDSSNLSRAAKKAIENSNPQKAVEYVRKHYNWQKAAEQFIAAL